MAIPFILLVVWLGDFLFDAVLALVLGLGALELYRAARGSWLAPLGLAAALSSAALVFAADSGYDWLVWALAGITMVSLAILVVTSDVESGALNWGAFLVGVTFCGFLGAHFALLRDASDGRDLVLIVLLGTYAADTAAYAAGKMIGRRKFAPRISPSKTWEGTASAGVGGIAAVLLLAWVLDVDWAFFELLGLALLFPVFAVVGDLAESTLKRSIGVKDTSSLIPGHGGIVDRLDSILFTAVLTYYWLIWVVE